MNMNIKKAKKKKAKTKTPPTEPETFDDFLQTLDDEDSSSESEEEEVDDGSEEEDQVNGSLEAGNGVEEEEDEEMGQGSESEELEGEDSEDDEGEGNGDESEDEDPQKEADEHKKALQRLQETDPDFFKYLKENDAELLNFAEEEEDDEESEESEDEEGPFHKPPEELEEASDSEAEEERINVKGKEYQTKVEKALAKRIVNLEVIRDWESKLSTTRDIGVFVNVMEAFECAVHQILEDGSSGNQKWKVEGSANFNALVRLCIRHVKSFCVRYICGSNNLAASEKHFDHRPLEMKDKNAQKWSKLRSKLKKYMGTLVKFLKSMGSSDAIASILRHCLKMSGFWALMGTKSFKLLRTLIHIWSSGEDSCRILAFLTIVRLTNYNKDVFLLRMYKQMYLAYVANSKFTSANTWPVLNLMRSSLTEMYSIDPELTYSVAFPFIRQLAIHLRNAMSTGTSAPKQNKAEASRIVYSWQFVHSLHMWVDVLSHSGTAQDGNLKLLIYPVVQVCLGTIKLIPTKKFIPLRFLIIRMLIKLQEKTGVFIPILPLITEVLLLTDFSLKSVSKFSVRPLDMSCCLKADASESGYTKAVSETAFELILRTCKAIATDLSFPEIVTPTLMQLRSFLKKKCKNPEVCRKYKTLVEKIDANSKYISDRRNKALEAGSFSLTDKESHKVLKVQMETSKPHPPILDFATEYLKVNARTQAKLRKINIETREEKLIPKPVPANSQGSKTKTSKLNSQLLESDEDLDDADFMTKLDVDQEPQPSGQVDNNNVKLKKKAKKQKPGKLDAKRQGPGAKKRKLVEETDAPDELVDLDFSD